MRTNLYLITARNLEMEQASTKFKAPKVRQLKVIDAKSAQNIGESTISHVANYFYRACWFKTASDL